MVVEKGRIAEVAEVIRTDKITQINSEQVRDDFSKRAMTEKYVGLYKSVQALIDMGLTAK